MRCKISDSVRLSSPRSKNLLGQAKEVEIAKRAEAGAVQRAPLSKERVLRGAIGIADQEGIDALTIRRLAQELGVEAMSLYYYGTNKGDTLKGVMDIVAEEIDVTVV